MGLLKFFHIFVSGAGKGVGSGGATLNALLVTVEHLSARWYVFCIGLCILSCYTKPHIARTVLNIFILIIVESELVPTINNTFSL